MPCAAAATINKRTAATRTIAVYKYKKTEKKKWSVILCVRRRARARVCVKNDVFKHSKHLLKSIYLVIFFHFLLWMQFFSRIYILHQWSFGLISSNVYVHIKINMKNHSTISIANWLLRHFLYKKKNLPRYERGFFSDNCRGDRPQLVYYHYQ